MKAVLFLIHTRTDRICEYSTRDTQFTLPNDFEGIILELGCGTKPTFRSNQPIVGIDITPIMVKTFKENYNTYTIIGDARKLPFRNRIFKLSVANALLHHIIGPTPNFCLNNIKKCFMETKRVIEKKGTFHIREMITPNYLFTLIMYYTTLLFSKLTIDINYIYIRSNVITYFLSNKKMQELITTSGYKIKTIEQTPWVERNIKLGEHINLDLYI